MGLLLGVSLVHSWQINWRNRLLNRRWKEIFPPALCWPESESNSACTSPCPSLTPSDVLGSPGCRGCSSGSVRRRQGVTCIWSPPPACPYGSHWHCTELASWPSCCDGWWQPQISPRYWLKQCLEQLSRTSSEVALQTSIRKDIQQALAP